MQLGALGDGVAQLGDLQSISPRNIYVVVRIGEHRAGNDIVMNMPAKFARTVARRERAWLGRSCRSSRRTAYPDTC